MKEVIDFYKDNPFNFSEDIKVYFDSIKNSNQVLEYEDLHNLLSQNYFFGEDILQVNFKPIKIQKILVKRRQRL